MIECGNWGGVGDADKGRKKWERNWRAGEEAGVTMGRKEELVWNEKREEKTRMEWETEEEEREVETDVKQDVGMAAMVMLDGLVESGGGDRGGPDEEEKGNEKEGPEGGARSEGEMGQEIVVAASTEEDRLFGHTSGYLMARHPIDYRRELTTEPWEIVSAWFEDSGIPVGPAAKAKIADRDPVITEKTARLFYTWKDLFARNLVEMPPTDLVTHTIPTRAGAVPVRAKDKL